MENQYPLPSELESLSVGYSLSKFVFGPAMIYFGIKGFSLAHPILTGLVCAPPLTAGIFFVIITVPEVIQSKQQLRRLAPEVLRGGNYGRYAPLLPQEPGRSLKFPSTFSMFAAHTHSQAEDSGRSTVAC